MRNTITAAVVAAVFTVGHITGTTTSDPAPVPVQCEPLMDDYYSLARDHASVSSLAVKLVKKLERAHARIERLKANR